MQYVKCKACGTVRSIWLDRCPKCGESEGHVLVKGEVLER